MADAAALRAALDRAVSTGGYLNGGVCLIDPEGWESAYVTGLVHPPHAATEPEQLRDPGLRMRMASISKSITARIACELAVGGVLPLEGDVRELLGWGDAPDGLEGVQVKMLLDHTSGLTDRAGYLPVPPESVTAFIEAAGAQVFSGRSPGSWFRYANLNYVLLGAVLETVTAARLDELARLLVLEPAGIGGGFNWSGVAPARRVMRLPVYQRAHGRMERRTEPDDADWSADIIGADGQGARYSDYVPGRDATRHSPHGGMRMSVIEAARLARFLADDSPAGRLQRTTSWVFDPERPNGTDCDGLYREYGLGVMIYRDHPRIPGPLVGHAGHALGFTGGAWHNEATGTSAAIFLTGSSDLTEDSEDESFYADAELALLQAL